MQIAGYPGVILAGGLARRMGGGDKGLMLLHGQSLIQQVITRLSPQVQHMAINANGDPARFAAFTLPVLPDLVPGFPGPLAGVLSAMDWAAGLGADAVVTVAADTPFFPDDLVARLQAAGGSAGFSLAATGAATAPDWHPTFGLWPTALRDTLRRDLLAGQRKVIGWALQNGARPALFGAQDDPFFNINTPEDLVAARLRDDL
ncbi:molybdenum cofactor guanylyltransferase MobA [Pseudotabrizicola alkalilacus]|uniref:Molybdenum cofactor guanylyltransferase n=1 Tax=Pseudotabrizicola alkalilacus TaxID=2305252 RepID=A0A411Z6N8_9RHOB|nr:molybdenum cofactor guanylyltransferase MobA [Pseudotabrizicola alkalilacus]RGP38733.1 molybdenum cofactor guanylyltransferase MobA [Pseudotabrizicola alkalilacus]